MEMSVLVTGGTKGIGLAIARRLADTGKTLFLAYHSDEEAAVKAKAQIEAEGATAHLILADVGTVAGATHIMERIGAHSGSLDHIVHSAAMIYPTTMLGADLQQFGRAVETNGLSLLYLVQKAMPLLGRGSSIVFISSSGARAVIRSNYGALGTAKALAEMIMLYLVPELAPLGIRINTVSPGLVHTTAVAAMVGSEEAAKSAVENAARANPSGRAARDSDYAAIVEFLLNPEAEFIQGQIIAANGGAFLVR
jgi:NAD(P)-dependent dehydrogenase (short-subunit alcohol dehydrogenase family)